MAEKTGNFKSLIAEILFEASQGCCGYIRDPELLGKHYVAGRCSLTNKICEYNIPKRTEDCEIANRRLYGT